MTPCRPSTRKPDWRSFTHPQTGATKPIPPGQSALLTLSLTPGTYMMSSTLLSDEALGEYGTLTVTSYRFPS